MKKTLIILVVFFFILSFSGCKRQQTNKNLLIVTSFYPIYISTINITKDVPGVQVVNLTKPFTGCLHDYALTTEDMKSLTLANIFVVNGAGMESFLDKVIQEMPDLKIVDASKGIDLIKNGETLNPHVWVSVSGAIQEVNNIATGLEKYDPANEILYRKNADAYIAELDKLKTRMKENLKDIKNRDIITFHEAFPYFAREFNLNIVAVIERTPGSEPNARELAQTVDIVRKNKIKVLFVEPQYPSESANVIAKETGAHVYTLDPAVSGPMEEDAYIEIMDKNLKVLEDAVK